MVEKSTNRLSWFKFETLWKSIVAVFASCFIFQYWPIKGGIFSTVGVMIIVLSLAFMLITEIWILVLLSKIEYSEKVILITKKLWDIKKVKLRTTIIGFSLSPVLLLAILMMMHNDFSDLQLPKISGEDLLPVIPIVLMFIVTIYYSFKFGMVRRFRQLSKDLDDLKLLEDDLDASNKATR